MMRLITLSLLATALVPLAAAECVGDTCISQSAYGDGCTTGSEDDYSYRAIVVSHGSSMVYVANECNSYNQPGYSEEGSSLAVGYFSYTEETGFQAAGVTWHGFTWNGQEDCSYGVYSYGMQPLPDGTEYVDCVNGPPGMILP